MVLTGITITEKPKWNRSKDIPASGGTATIANTYGGTVMAYFDDGTSANVTTSTTFTGELTIGPSSLTYRHSAGLMEVTASYTYAGVTKTDTTYINVYQAASTTPVIVSLALVLSAVGDVPYTGGLSSAYILKQVLGYDTYGTATDVTSLSTVTFSPSEISENTTSAARAITITGTAVYADLTVNATISLNQLGKPESTLDSITMVSVALGDIPANGATESQLPLFIKNTVTAYYTDGSTKDISNAAELYITYDPSSVGTNTSKSSKSVTITVRAAYLGQGTYQYVTLTQLGGGKTLSSLVIGGVAKGMIPAEGISDPDEYMNYIERTVTATYTDGTSEDVTNLVTYTYSPETISANTSKTAYKYYSVMVYATYTVGVTMKSCTAVSVTQDKAADATVSSISVSAWSSGNIPQTGTTNIGSLINPLVTAHYTDGSTKDVTSECTITYTPMVIPPNETDDPQTYKILVTATYSDPSIPQSTYEVTLTQDTGSTVGLSFITLGAVSSGVEVPVTGATDLTPYITRYVIGTYSDSSTKILTSDCDYTYYPSSIPANTSPSKKTHTISVTATYRNDTTKTSTKNVDIIQEAPEIVIQSIKLVSTPNGGTIPSEGSNDLSVFTTNTVIATLSDGTTLDVTSSCTFAYAPESIPENPTSFTKSHDIQVSAVYTPDASFTASQTINLTQDGIGTPKITAMILAPISTGTNIPCAGTTNVGNYIKNIVIAVMSDNTTRDITALCSFSYEPSEISENTSSVIISHDIKVTAVYSLDTTFSDTKKVSLNQDISGTPTVEYVEVVATPKPGVSIPSDGTSLPAEYMDITVIGHLTGGGTQDITSSCDITTSPVTIDANPGETTISRTINVIVNYKPDPTITGTAMCSVNQSGTVVTRIPLSLEWTELPEWDEFKDISSHGGTGDITHTKNYELTVTYTDGTTKVVTDDCTISGSTSFPSSYKTVRHTCGRFITTASYTESGVTVKTSNIKVYAYQRAFVSGVSLDHIEFTKEPEWNPDKDISHTGGDATGDCVQNYKVMAYYTDGTSKDVTNSCGLSGGKEVPASTDINRHTAGKYKVTARYTEDGIICSDTSDFVTIYQSAYSSRYLTSISFTIQPVWNTNTDISWMGGIANSTNTINSEVTAFYSDGTSRVITSEVDLDGDLTVTESTNPVRHDCGTFVIGAIYTEDGIECSCISNNITAYQIGKAVRTPVSISFEPSPVWNPTTDINPDGGTADWTNMEDFKIIVTYSDGTKCDVTTLCDITGELDVPPTDDEFRHSVGTIKLTAVYEENDTPVSTESNEVPIYQTGKKPKEISHIEFYTNPQWATNVPAEGGTATIDNCTDYTVVAYYTDGTSSEVTEKCTFTGSLDVPESTSSEECAVGVLTITAHYTKDDFIGEVTANVVAVQDGATGTVTVSPTSLSHPSSGKSDIITITSNTSWTVSVIGSGFSIDKASGEGNDTITVTSYPNTSMTSRTGSIIITYVGGTITVPITQAGLAYTVSPLSLNFNCAGETLQLTVTSSVAWTASVDGDGFSIDTTSGSTSGIINVTASKNTTSADRPGTVTVTFGGTDITVTLLQFKDSTIPSEVYNWVSFTASSSNKLKITNTMSVFPSLYYSYSGASSGNVWTPIVSGDELEFGTTDHPSIYVCGNNAVSQSAAAYYKFDFTNTTPVTIGGHIAGLKDPKSSVSSLPDWSFYRLLAETPISGCNVSPQELNLSFNELGKFCFKEMFKDCTALTELPSLESPTMAEGCYWGMFSGCSSVVTPTVLASTALAASCYREMFKGCTSLTTAPDLPTTGEIPEYAYASMFEGCTSLVI